MHISLPVFSRWVSVVYIALTGGKKRRSDSPLRTSRLHYRGAALPELSFRYAKGNTPAHWRKDGAGFTAAKPNLTTVRFNKASSNALSSHCLLFPSLDTYLTFLFVLTLCRSLRLTLVSLQHLSLFLRPSNSRDGRGNPALSYGKPHAAAASLRTRGIVCANCTGSPAR